MNTDHSAIAEVIDLDAVRRARKLKRTAIRLGLLRDVMSSKDAIYTREIADTITLQQGRNIAQCIVDKFSAKGSLLAAFIERRKRDSLDQEGEFLDILTRQKRMVAYWSPDQLKALLVLYSRNPNTHYETYV